MKDLINEENVLISFRNYIVYNLVKLDLKNVDAVIHYLEIILDRRELIFRIWLYRCNVLTVQS